jgi:hypothetical protein
VLVDGVSTLTNAAGGWIVARQELDLSEIEPSPIFRRPYGRPAVGPDLATGSTDRAD